MEGVMVEWLLINAHGTGVMVSVKRGSGTSITPPGLQKVERRGHVSTRRLAVPVRGLVVQNDSLFSTAKALWRVEKDLVFALGLRRRTRLGLA